MGNDLINLKLKTCLTPQNLAHVEKGNETLLKTKQGLDKLGISFFLIHGNLLGVIRDGHLIPFEGGDIDVATFVNPLEIGEERMKKVFEEIPGLRWRRLEGPVEVEGVYVSCLYLFGPWPISIEFWSRVPGTGRVRTYGSKLWCPAHCFDTMKEIEFLGKTFKVPGYYEDLLRWNYGKRWRIQSRMDHKNRKRRWVKCDINGIPEQPLIVTGSVPGFYLGTWDIG